MRVLILGLFLTLVAATAAVGQVTSDRIAVLEDEHGYFPCMDCHGDQETVATPRILEEEHAEPLEVEDEDGNIILIPFGRLVAIADLLGEDGTDDLAGRNLARIGKRLDIASYMEMNDLSPADSVWTLVHGGGNLWCLSCHDEEDRDKLKGADSELMTFNQSQFLCGACHGPTLRDWEADIHGKTTGAWNPAANAATQSVRLLCVECHPAHDPVFTSLEPMPGPVPRVDAPGQHGTAHDAVDPDDDPDDKSEVAH